MTDLILQFYKGTILIKIKKTLLLLLLPTLWNSTDPLNHSTLPAVYSNIHRFILTLGWYSQSLSNSIICTSIKTFQFKKKKLNSWVLELFILVARHNILRRPELYSHECWTAPFFHCYLVVRLLWVKSIFFFFNATNSIIPFLYSTLF